jgi:hypothetical protein
VLVYATNARLNCDLSDQLGSFVYTVQIDICHKSPAKGPFLESYFRVDKQGLTFYSDFNCGSMTDRVSFQKTACEIGWFAIFLAANLIMV